MPSVFPSIKADTIVGLAKLLGLDSPVLEKTVAANAVKGHVTVISDAVQQAISCVVDSRQVVAQTVTNIHELGNQMDQAVSELALLRVDS